MLLVPKAYFCEHLIPYQVGPKVKTCLDAPCDFGMDHEVLPVDDENSADGTRGRTRLVVGCALYGSHVEAHCCPQPPGR